MVVSGLHCRASRQCKPNIRCDKAVVFVVTERLLNGLAEQSVDKPSGPCEFPRNQGRFSVANRVFQRAVAQIEQGRFGSGS